jgi:hypothetical protein
VERILLFLTNTAPTWFRRQVDLLATTAAICMKYSSRLGRLRRGISLLIALEVKNVTQPIGRSKAVMHLIQKSAEDSF